jgi:hypothetical protein
MSKLNTIQTSKFLLIILILLTSLVQKGTTENIYKTLARPVLTYESEAWMIRKAGEKRLLALEMESVRPALKHE